MQESIDFEITENKSEILSHPKYIDQEIKMSDIDTTVLIERLKDISKSICRIICSNGEKGTGFFLMLPLLEKGTNEVATYLYSLITSSHLIKNYLIKYEEYIIINFNEEKETRKIKLSNERYIYQYQTKEEDVTIIEIVINQDKISEEYFLKFNDKYFTEGRNYYLDKPIIVYQHPKITTQFKFSFGTIIKFDIEKYYKLYHNAETEKGSSGAPILLASTFEVIGIYNGYIESESIRFGTLLGCVVDQVNAKSMVELGEDKCMGRYVEKGLEGFVKYYFGNGDIYIGHFNKNKKDGEGTYYFGKTSKYTGQWKKDKKEGFGIYSEIEIKKNLDDEFNSNNDTKNIKFLEKYAGYLKNDKKEGYGIQHYSNGDKYKGYWVNNKKQGKGIFQWYKSNKYKLYIGEFKSDQIEGFGKLYMINDDEYEGMFKYITPNEYNNKIGNKTSAYLKLISGISKSNIQKEEKGFSDFHGQGTYIYKNKNEINFEKYEGSWFAGKKEGHGIMYFKTKEKYVGDWKDDLMDGEGALYDDKGRIIRKGEWKLGKFFGSNILNCSDGEYIGKIINNKKNGEGIMKYNNGFIYEGGWKDDNKHGYGKLKNKNKLIYYGFWENNQINGLGTIIYSDGSIYTGQFVNGKKQGQGKIMFPNEDKYQGSFVNDEINGLGTYIYKDGHIFKGCWVDGKKEGFGIYYDSNGGIENCGEWKNNEYYDETND